MLGFKMIAANCWLSTSNYLPYQSGRLGALKLSALYVHNKTHLTHLKMGYINYIKIIRVIVLSLHWPYSCMISMYTFIWCSSTLLFTPSLWVSCTKKGGFSETPHWPKDQAEAAWIERPSCRCWRNRWKEPMEKGYVSNHRIICIYVSMALRSHDLQKHIASSFKKNSKTYQTSTNEISSHVSNLSQSACQMSVVQLPNVHCPIIIADDHPPELPIHFLGGHTYWTNKRKPSSDLQVHWSRHPSRVECPWTSRIISKSLPSNCSLS